MNYYIILILNSYFTNLIPLNAGTIKPDQVHQNFYFKKSTFHYLAACYHLKSHFI